uniref:Hsp70 n=1 Tax=Ganoderma boninense TaxID=34458 RepID=A0A5K1K0G1_9APHY|nr:Hsp70 [Ganoderma boninense]
MGKNKKPSVPHEDHLLLPQHAARPSPSSTPIVDTHTHLLSTYSSYRSKYKQARYATVYDFVRELYNDRGVDAIVDVYCEAPEHKTWKEIADSALTEQGRRELWGGLEYWFVMVQQDVFVRQLKHAVRLGKPLTIHTREAEEDSERILKEHVPKAHRIHIHCYTDSPEWAARMLDHFPNLYIGITGVITYSTNLNTSEVIRRMAASSNEEAPLRILLETDAPFMTPSNIYNSLKNLKGRLPISHSAMIPWTAEFVANVANETATEGGRWDTLRVMRESRENARKMYGV